MTKKLPFIAAVTALSLLAPSCERAKEKVQEAQAASEAKGDVTFAKSTFESLARGDTEVSKRIDWPVLTSMGENVGATYVALPSDTEKQKFILSFITQFAVSFRESGGSIENFTNWRVSFHDKTRTEVLADSPGGLLTLVVSQRNDVERVSSISVVK